MTGRELCKHIAEGKRFKIISSTAIGLEKGRILTIIDDDLNVRKNSLHLDFGILDVLPDFLAGRIELEAIE